MTSVQNLPASGPEREALREKGQFWTPAWVAEAMVGYVIAGGSKTIFDPAVGAGAFFQAAKVLTYRKNQSIKLLGTELDPNALYQARENGLTESDLAQVQITDFVLEPPQGPFDAIVANPPYIRHHRLLKEDKLAFKVFVQNLLGKSIDGRAGLHIYFLLRALQLLAPEGRLAFIAPADICEGVFANSLWLWITKHYKLEVAITFDHSASPFPKVDTNPIIFLISHTKPSQDFLWTKCMATDRETLKDWIFNGCNEDAANGLILHRRSIEEGIATGLSRPPQTDFETGPTLADFVTVVRGIATGANDFFFLTSEKATTLGIPHKFLKTAIGRTRDVTGSEITEETIKDLEKKGRPTRLLSLDGRPMEDFPEVLRNYLKQGEKLGVNTGELIKQRNPWYKMEVRNPPPFLFAYLGRRNIRFIRNRIGILPLTGFLCVYPHAQDEESIEKLLKVLTHPKTLANLALVGKSYGSGAIKVEPRALEHLPLPPSVISELNLQLPKPKQGRFWKM